MRCGTAEHLALFCDSFIGTHRAYDPAALPWPPLDPAALAFLRSVPFFGTILAVETNAGTMLRGFAETLEEPRLREAVTLQAFEEERHAAIIEAFLRAYEIEWEMPSTPPAAPTRREFTAFGYQESLETFLGYGVFSIAGKASLFPAQFLANFDDLLTEEARHITFFANWVAYERARSADDGAIAELRDAIVGYYGAATRMVRSFSNDVGGPWFNAHNARSLVGEVRPVDILVQCVHEHRRHMAAIDKRLKQPRFMPTIAQAAIAALRRLPPRTTLA